MKKILFLNLILLNFLFINLESRYMAPKPKGFIDKTFTLTSPAFEDGKDIPAKYTCDGSNVSPELRWETAPENTQSFAIIVEDPDAAQATPWVHWIVYNIDSGINKLQENIKTGDFDLGQNDFGQKAWGGPCPPAGKHRYNFRIYALDTKLDIPGTVTREKLLSAIEGHIIARTQIVGLYEKK